MIVDEYVTQIIFNDYGGLRHQRKEQIVRCQNCENRDGCWCQWFNFEIIDFNNFCSFGSKEGN
jgi:hypothetical protein